MNPVYKEPSDVHDVAVSIEMASNEMGESSQELEIHNEDPLRATMKRSSQDIQKKNEHLLNSIGQMTIGPNPIEIEELSEIEITYRQKCEAMIQMYNSLKCICHSTTFSNLKGLFSHLRSAKIWFPVFTCFHCMITFADSFSSKKHINKCSKKNLEGLVQLSKIKKRGHSKARLYQKYRCSNCSLIFTFWEDFCDHVSTQHSDATVVYYCDICRYDATNLQDFIEHAQNQHDDSEELAASLMEKLRSQTPLITEPKAKKINLLRRKSTTNIELRSRSKLSDGQKQGQTFLRGIRRTRSSSRFCTEPNGYQTDNETQRRYSKIRQQTNNQADDNGQISMMDSNINKKPTVSCLLCRKVYSSYGHMMRHFRIHQAAVSKETNNAQQETSEKCMHLRTEVYKETPVKNRVSVPYQSVNINPIEDDIQVTSNISKTQNNSVRCPQCGKEYSNKWNMMRHFKIHNTSDSTEKNPPQKEISEELIQSKTEVNKETYDEEHVYSNILETKNITLLCPKCSKEYSNRGNLTRHLRKHHPNNEELNQQENNCATISNGDTFQENKNLRKRKKVSSEEEPKNDESSGEDEPNPKNPKKSEHISTTCPKCHKVYSSRSNMLKHFKKH